MIINSARRIIRGRDKEEEEKEEKEEDEEEEVEEEEDDDEQEEEEEEVEEEQEVEDTYIYCTPCQVSRHSRTQHSTNGTQPNYTCHSSDILRGQV